ncbi:MAG TPA: stage IV sporulation protein A [Eubacteriales bacterium]|nr:stage IV sporulation protein A [Eubacteriales bacterium]
MQQQYDIYGDIARRTNGDIYIGVVGPVRSGKSTFVTAFMEKLVLPNIKNKNVKKRAVDELPQSAEGKTIMTTQPKFVPNEAVQISISDNMVVNARLIDCVGYLIDGAMGHEENEKARMVKTPWSDSVMPFEQAAQIGTQKVVTEHSNIAVVITTDGSITDIPRANYVSAEERVVDELKELGKPFVVVLNTKNPKNEETVSLCAALQEKYGVSVLPVDVLNIEAEGLESILKNVLDEFPVKKLVFGMPKWMQTLPADNYLITSIIEKIKGGCGDVLKMKDAPALLESFKQDENLEDLTIDKLNMGDGVANYRIEPKEHLFYEVLSAEAGMDISDQFGLMSFVTGCASAKKHYEAMKDALDDVNAIGYGVVAPSFSEMTLEDPEIVKSGTRYGVRLKASAPSLHILRVDVTTEVNPMVGSEQQSQYLLSEFQNNPKGIWETDIFGKSLASLAKEGLSSKLNAMPSDAQEKLRKTVGRIVNEGKGSLICILL